MFAEDISEDFSDLTFTGIYSLYGYLRNLRGRLLSSEKFSEVFTLWIFTLKPFPGEGLHVPKKKLQRTTTEVSQHQTCAVSSLINPAIRARKQL